jgi:hypothetical protein
MTDQPHGAPPERLPPWPMIIGVAVLGVLGLVLLLLVITRDPDGTASSSATPSATASASASSSGSGPASPSATAAATASSDAPAAGIPTDGVAATTVADLTVRASPGLDGEPLGTLESGALSFVAGGPTDADGFPWYLVSGLGLPPNTGCAGEPETEPYNCPIWFGWVAAASEDGEAWLVEHDVVCPQEPYTVENVALGRTALERLSCFGSEPFSFRGYWPEIPDDAGLGGACAAQEEPSGWLLCQNINTNYIVIDESEDFGGIGIRVSIDPATDATMPERGTWVEVRVHLDDPAAQGCDEAAEAFDEQDRPAEQYVLECRAEAVLEAAEAVDGP